MNLYAHQTETVSGHTEPVRMLLEDHYLVRALISEYRQLHVENRSPDDLMPRKERIARSIMNLLTVHECIEEEILYARARKVMTHPGLVDEAVLEQKQARLLINDLQRLPVTDSRFDHRFALLLEMVELHATEEEKQVFPAIEQWPLDFQQMAVDLAVRKTELLDKQARPKP